VTFQFKFTNILNNVNKIFLRPGYRMIYRASFSRAHPVHLKCCSRTLDDRLARRGRLLKQSSLSCQSNYDCSPEAPPYNRSDHVNQTTTALLKLRPTTEHLMSIKLRLLSWSSALQQIISCQSHYDYSPEAPPYNRSSHHVF